MGIIDINSKERIGRFIKTFPPISTFPLFLNTFHANVNRKIFVYIYCAQVDASKFLLRFVEVFVHILGVHLIFTHLKNTHMIAKTHPKASFLSLLHKSRIPCHKSCLFLCLGWVGRCRFHNPIFKKWKSKLLTNSYYRIKIKHLHMSKPEICKIMAPPHGITFYNLLTRKIMRIFLAACEHARTHTQSCANANFLLIIVPLNIWATMKKKLYFFFNFANMQAVSELIMYLNT